MAVSRIPYTYLSQALDADTKRFFITSTSGMSVGDMFVCRQEAMKVQEILSSTEVSVLRGVNGSRPRPHPTNQRFFYASPEKFKATKESLTAVLGDSGTYPDYLLPGQRATDGEGNHYVLLDLTSTVTGGCTVIFGNSYTAQILTSGRQGSVAVVVEAATSGQYVWGQIYGYNAYVQDAGATSGATSAYVCVAASSVSTPQVGMALAANGSGQYAIYGMFIQSVATTTVTAATSSTGVAGRCWLNYPYTTNRVSLSSAAP